MREEEEEEEDVSLNGQVVPRKDTFRYLGSMLQKDRNINEDVNHRIKAEWMKWCQAFGLLCDKRVPQKLKAVSLFGKQILWHRPNDSESRVLVRVLLKQIRLVPRSLFVLYAW
jgi:hypothetical protein